MVLYILHELASGFALFEKISAEEIGQKLDSFQESIIDLSKFGKMVKLKSFIPFKNAAEALSECNDVSEGILSLFLKSFLEMNLPKNKNVVLGVSEKNLAGSIKTELNIECESNEQVHELTRGIRLHLEKLLSQSTINKAQLGLGHAYSRAKVKFNVNRQDNMITQAICMLDQLDKDINTFSMRIREWYSWHFPELIKIVSENNLFAKAAKFIGNKNSLSQEKLEGLTEIIGGDSIKAKQILDASKSSMGTEISEIDMMNISVFAEKVISLSDYRKELFSYLNEKMETIAPNLSALVGEIIGARLISHAGSLTTLSKYPASTVQILGAEKALFRALKAKQGKTPKYGLIFHSTFIGRAGIKNKGRISRYLANKCSIASRLDCFLDNPTSKFGEALKSQVEDRLKFYETGVVGQKNEEVMKLVLDELEDNEELQKEPSPKRKNEDVEMENVEEKKKSKKKSKSKGNDGEMKEEVVKSKSEKKKNEESKKKKKKEKKEGK